VIYAATNTDVRQPKKRKVEVIGEIVFLEHSLYKINEVQHIHTHKAVKKEY